MQNKRIFRGLLVTLAALVALAGGLWLNHRPAEQPPASADIAEAEPEATATPALDPPPPETDPAGIAEKLKEVTTYRNEEFGLMFQHPKYQMQPDGTVREDRTSRMDSGLSMIPLELLWAEASLRAFKKPSDFSTLRAYIDEKNTRIQQRAKEDGDPLCLNQHLRAIQVGKREAFLRECITGGRRESVVYIDAPDYVFHIFYLGHLGVQSQAPDVQHGLQFVRTLLETWTSFEEEQ